MPHTPGPWTVHDLWNNNPCIENGGVFEVEEAHYDVKESLEAGCDVERIIKGNARLIAQAPEMYGLLKRLEWAGSFIFADGTPRCLHCDARKYPNYPISDEIGEHRSGCRLAAVLKAVEGE